MRKKTAIPADPPVADKKLYVVTDPIQGFVQNRRIQAVRGDKLHLSDDEAKVFKDSILEI